MTQFALIHSPLVGPFTWQPVAESLRRRGWSVIVPHLHGQTGAVVERPYHQHHAQNGARSIQNVPQNEPIILVAHSGAGPLLPAIRQQLTQPIAAYVFVDAGIARDGQSRLDMLAAELPAVAPELKKLLQSGQRWPQWTDQDLVALVPKAERRQRLLAELTPQPLPFFEEPLPVFAGWPDAPCAYLQLSSGYDYSAAEAAQRGWPVARLAGGHFQLLVDETAVTDHILNLLNHLTCLTPL